jgi:sec-independent protein translocase protein TatC
VGVATPLFLGGVLLAYTILPIGLELLLGFTPENVENIVSVDRYLSFFLRTILVFGIGFLAPLLLVVLNFAGILTGKRLAS